MREEEEEEEQCAQVPVLIGRTIFKRRQREDNYHLFNVHSMPSNRSMSMMNNSSSTLDHFFHLDFVLYPLIFFLSCFCLVTVVGNALVIYAVVQERYLKSVTYYYMASLACADLFVGLIVMPFAIVQVIYGDYWPFGKTYCDLWHSIDVCASTASILDLCVIALDRYSAITNPITYHRAFFVKRWPYLLAAVWLCSGLISFPAIAYWRWMSDELTYAHCAFPDDIYYAVISSLISFYIPLFVMIFVYIRIYRAAISQLRAFKTGVKLTSTSNSNVKKKKQSIGNAAAMTNLSSDVCLRIHRGKYRGVQVEGDSSLTDGSLSHYSLSNDHSTFVLNKKMLGAEKARQSLGKRLMKFSKEQKATITLAYVMGIFVICWLPFFVYNPLTAVAKLFLIKKSSLNRWEKFLQGNDLVFQLFTWFGYLNSSVNPIIYAYSSREFRRAFIKYLCRCFPRRLRNSLMTYHHLRRFTYHHRPSSLISAENLESNSDNTNRQVFVPSTSSTPTAILVQVQNKTARRKTLPLLLNQKCTTPLSSPPPPPTHPLNDKAKNPFLVDYCTYHDVAVSRVTCL